MTCNLHKLLARTLMQNRRTPAISNVLRHVASDKPDEIKIPDPPTNCCMSNCANCVWIQYAKDLENLFADGGETAQKLVMEKLEDPSLKAFLSLELRVALKEPKEPKS